MLVWNPTAGRRREQRRDQVQRAADALAALGHRVQTAETAGPGSATELARRAALDGAEIVYACGGDGTAHEVAQALISETGAPRTTLGIVPLGSANSLARDLGIPVDPVKAVLAQVEGEARTVPVGRLQCGGVARCFLGMAGAGPDGMLAAHVRDGAKARFGRLAYSVQAARLFASRRFAPFDVELTGHDGEVLRRRAVCAMAVRMRDLGGLFAGLAGSGASFDDEHLKIAIVRPPAAISLPIWFVSGWMRMTRVNPLVEFAEAERCVIRAVNDEVYVQADGEWLGTTPVEMSVAPNALRIARVAPSHRRR